jgi:hypothetical protein
MMLGMRPGYLFPILAVWCLNIWALLYHLSVVSGFEELIGATLFTNMLTAPIIIWMTFVYGEITEEAHLRRRRWW